MVETLSSTFLNNFVLIFVAIDPFALIPIFAGITHGLQKKEIKSIYPVSYTHLTLPTNREV